MKQKERDKDRKLYRGTLQDKKQIWQLHAQGLTAKQISQQTNLANSTIYKWVKELENMPPKRVYSVYEPENPPQIIIDVWKSANQGKQANIRKFDELLDLKTKSEKDIVLLTNSTTVKQNAILDHIQEVNNLLEDWFTTIKKGVVYSTRGIEFDFEVEKQPLFTALLSHYQSINKVWKRFKSIRLRYKEAISKLVTELNVSLPTNINYRFSSYVIDYAIYLALGGELPIYEISMRRLLIQNGNESFNIANGDLDMLENLREKHRELVQKYSVSDPIMKIVTVRTSLVALEKDLLAKITNARISKEYIKYSCFICRSLKGNEKR